MKPVTRDVDVEVVADLWERPPRACLSFAGARGPEVVPVVVWRDNRYLVGVPAGAGRQPSQYQEVVLLSDDGLYFFDLRALYVRGTVTEVPPPDGAPDDHAWFELHRAKEVAWDYGTLRQAPDAG